MTKMQVSNETQHQRRPSWVLTRALRRASDAPVSRSLKGPIGIPTEALKGPYWPCQRGPQMVQFPKLLENSVANWPWPPQIG